MKSCWWAWCVGVAVMSGCSSFNSTFKALPDGTIECNIDLRYNGVSSDAEFSVVPILQTITVPHLDSAGKPILDPAGKPMEKPVGVKVLAWKAIYKRRTDISGQIGDMVGKAFEGGARGASPF